jgi:hypothetical protein
MPEDKPGFAHDEDLDPIVFAEPNDSPELRAEALLLPRPRADEKAKGPKVSRKELLENSYSDEAPQNDWIPGEPMKVNNPIPKNYSEVIGKILLGFLPIGIIVVFFLYASTQV